jgi:hypothetical protein
VNTNATFWEPRGTGTWGFVARDHDGEFVAEAGKLRLRLASPLWMVLSHLHHVVFESHSLTLVNALNSNSYNLYATGVCCFARVEACALLLLSIPYSSFSHCRGNCNKVAEDELSGGLI